MAVAIKQITSSAAFQDPQGNHLVNGLLVFDLSMAAQVTGGAGQVVPTRVSVKLDSTGNIPSGTVLWANDQLLPSGTVYYVSMFNSNGLLVSGPLIWSITGASPINLSLEFPVSLATLSFSLPGFNLVQLSSSGSFTIPDGITKLKVTVVGGGGAGGGSNGANCGTGGASGAIAIKWLAGLTAQNTLTVTVGLGGTGMSASSGNPGGTSSVSSGTQIISTISASGGGGGFGPSTGGNGGGVPGTASGGDLNIAGSQGPPSSSGTVGLPGATCFFGGNGIAASNSGGLAATGFGAGGGGAQGTGPFAGGAGAGGLVLFEWII